MLLCSDDIQAVSLRSFVQGIEPCQAVLATILVGPKRDRAGIFFGLDSVSGRLVGWDSVGQILNPLSNLVEHIEAQNYQQVFYYDF